MGDDSDAARHRTLAASFGAAADAYERGRPGYPADALDFLIPASAHDVIDLGAGTGKLTRLLLARGLDVTAVDPSPEMLRVLRRVAPDASAVQGTAERMPVADAAADVVLAAQSWHWADPVEGSREVARVLRPGGTVGLIWNFADETVDWVRRLHDIYVEGGSSSATAAMPQVASPFGEMERFDTSWSVPMTRSDVIDMVASRSYVIEAAPGDRQRILDGVEALLDEVLDAEASVVDLPYVTVAFRATLPVDL